MKLIEIKVYEVLQIKVTDEELNQLEELQKDDINNDRSEVYKFVTDRPEKIVHSYEEIKPIKVLGEYEETLKTNNRFVEITNNKHLEN